MLRGCGSYWKRRRIIELFWLAIESACTPSCCWVCRAWLRVEASFMSASTKALTPAVRLSESTPMKDFWDLNRALLEPSIAEN